MEKGKQFTDYIYLVLFKPHWHTYFMKCLPKEILDIFVV